MTTPSTVRYNIVSRGMTMKRYSDQEIAEIHSRLSSPQFNALRIRIELPEPVEQLSPWEYTAVREGDQSAKLEPDSKPTLRKPVARRILSAASI